MTRSPYRMAIIAGIGVAVYLYAFRFDRYSEEQLVWYAYGWVCAIIFGTYGLVAEGVANMARERPEISFGRALGEWLDAHPVIRSNAILHLILMIYLAPLLLAAFVLRTLNPPGLALAGAMVYLVLMKLFFDQVFPLL